MKRKRGRPSTVNYQEMERLYNLVYTDKEISQEINCSINTVQCWRDAHDAAPNNELKCWMRKEGIIK